MAIAREVKARAVEGSALNNLGLAYAGLGQYEQALALHEQALTIARQVQHREREGRALNNLGVAYRGLSQYERAIAFYEQALTIQREVKDRAGEGTTLDNLMAVWKAHAQPRLAIFYGKLAVNVYQAIRTDIQGLDQELQQSFLTSKTGVYRTLADLLIAEGRLPEAQQVLDLLKEEEFFDFVRRDAQATRGLRGRAALTPDEAAWEARYRAITDRLAAIGTEYGRCCKQPSRTATDTQRLMR